MRQRSICRRAVTWCAITGYALVISGLPLPLGGVAPGSMDTAVSKRLAAKDRSTPFPCMNRPCGCVSAEQCRKKCCCQRPDRGRAAAPAGASMSLDGPDICRDYESLAATSHERTTPASTPIHAAPSPDDEPLSSRTVVLQSMLACGGMVAQWLSVGRASPPPVVVAVVTIAPLVGAIPPSDAVFSCDRDAPDAPPPRVA
jgi:hypothetical protein